MRKGPGDNPICKWAYWEFPFPETYNKVLRVVDVQGIGRLWRLGDVNAIKTVARPKKVKYGPFWPGVVGDKLEHWEWSALDEGWVLGPFSPASDLFHVYLQDDMYAVKFVSTRAFLLCFGSTLASHNFTTFKPPHGTGLLNKNWSKFSEARRKVTSDRYAMAARIASILDSLPPEWTLVVEGLAPEERKAGGPRPLGPRSVHLFNSARYEAEFVGATKTSGVGIVC